MSKDLKGVYTVDIAWKSPSKKINRLALKSENGKAVCLDPNCF